jgi:hypothetical protein
MKRLMLLVLVATTLTMLIPSFTPSADAISKRLRESHQRVLNR